MWDEYIDPAYRERRPQLVIDGNGAERISVEGLLLGNPRGIGSLGSIGVRQGDVSVDTLKYEEGCKGGLNRMFGLKSEYGKWDNRVATTLKKDTREGR